MGGDAAVRQAAVDEFLAMLRLEHTGDALVGRTPDWYGPVVFGGIGLALTVSAACTHAPAGSRLSSVHAHFLRPLLGGEEVVFSSSTLKAGRTLSIATVTGSQAGKPVISATCSFTSDTEGYVYDLAGIPDDVPMPEELMEPEGVHDDGIWPWDTRWVGPSDLRPDGTREA